MTCTFQGEVVSVNQCVKLSLIFSSETDIHVRNKFIHAAMIWKENSGPNSYDKHILARKLISGSLEGLSLSLSLSLSVCVYVKCACVRERVDQPPPTPAFCAC
jgi:hypothetical protein